MTTFLWVQFIAGTISVLARMAYLSWKDYPRTVTSSRGEDVLFLMLGTALTLWAAWLLFVP